MKKFIVLCTEMFYLTVLSIAKIM